MSARILTDGAHLPDGTHMSGDEVRDTVTVSPDGREFVHGGRRIPVGNWPPGTRRYLSEGVSQ